MSEIVTEKNYPIDIIWLFKDIIFLPITLLILYPITLTQKYQHHGFPMGDMFLWVCVLALGVPAIYKSLLRINFHYSFEKNFIVLHQGIISKENRNVPYGRIQGVFINQKLFERICGLASLTIEDYSQGGQSVMSIDGYVGSGKGRHEICGFVGNRIYIPALKKEDAEALKAFILQKIKENPVEDRQSGL